MTYTSRPQVGTYPIAGADPGIPDVIRLDCPLQRRSVSGQPESDLATPPTNSKGEENLAEFLQEFREQARSALQPDNLSARARPSAF